MPDQSRNQCMIARLSVHDQPSDQCMMSQVISACTVTLSVHDEPRDQCMIPILSVHDSYVISASSAM